MNNQKSVPFSGTTKPWYLLTSPSTQSGQPINPPSTHRLVQASASALRSSTEPVSVAPAMPTMAITCLMKSWVSLLNNCLNDYNKIWQINGRIKSCLCKHLQNTSQPTQKKTQHFAFFSKKFDFFTCGICFTKCEPSPADRLHKDKKRQGPANLSSLCLAFLKHQKIRPCGRICIHPKADA